MDMSSRPSDERPPPWLVRASKELGVHEAPGTDNNARIVEYHQATKLKAKADSVPWCSAFCCWVFEQEGIESTRSAAASSWATWGQECELKPGAVVVFSKADPDAAGTGHVGFCVGTWRDSVWVLGGNQGDAVTIAKRPKSRIVAVRWPVVD